MYIAQQGDSLADLPAHDPNIDRVYSIRAGKLRRYHGESLIKQLLDFSTVAKNIRDIFFTISGIWQSIFLLKKLSPDVVFVKGGFVGLPVGLAAALWRIPYVTHDSDALPGLANRIIAPWATMHAVAMPKEIYAYPQEKTVSVGVPVSSKFHELDHKEMLSLRDKLNLKYRQVILLTGGGNGSGRLNQALIGSAPLLMERYKDLGLVHLAGRSHEQAVRQEYKKILSPDEFKRVVIRGYASNLSDYSAASDIVITRAGATSIAEFASQAKPCIVIPSPVLTGGHQLKNAQVLADRKAIRVVREESLDNDPAALMAPLTDLLDDHKKLTQLGQRLKEFEQSDSAYRLAMILLDVGKDEKEK